MWVPPLRFIVARIPIKTAATFPMVMVNDRVRLFFDAWGLATSRRKIDLSALWSTVPGDAKPAGDDRRGLPSVAMLE